MKLVNWKKGAALIAAGVGVVALSTYSHYREQGSLSAVDYVVAIISIVTLAAIVLGIGWWANKPEKEDA